MLDPKELWIGERLRNKENGSIGTFEGEESSGVVLIKSFNQIIKIHVSYLELAPEEEIPDPSIEKITSPLLGKKLTNKSMNTIDLHIEVLRPNLIQERQERIFKEQINSFESFIQNAILAKLPHVIIIHGKGEGILRAEIQSRLKMVYLAKIIQTIHDGGATEAWL